MSEEKKDLLPCPFCGSSAMLEELGDHHGAYHNLGCSKRECPAHHAIYTESEAPVEDSVNWWNTRAALQESEAGAVYGYIQDLQGVWGTGGFKHSVISYERIEDKGYVIPVYLAPPSAQAIETAAIMKCAEVCEKQAEALERYGYTVAAINARDHAKLILALIPQDGRTQLEEFGMKVAEAIEEAVSKAQIHDLDVNLEAIVANLIGAAK